MDEGQAVILDHGSSACKAGFSRDGEPRVELSALTAFPKARPAEERQASRGGDQSWPKGGWRPGGGHLQGAVANSAEWDDLLASGVADVRRPIQNGVVTDWLSLEAIWQRAFAELGVPDGGRPVLVTEPPLASRADREQMAQILFESLDATAVHVAVSGTLPLYGMGSRTGLVVEVGDGVAQTVPIFEEFVNPRGVQRWNFGGRDLTEYLERLLRERFCSLDAGSGWRAATAIKEQHCYVAQNYAAEMSAASSNTDLERRYQLPDGSHVMSVYAERFQCPEVLFSPRIVGRDCPGIHQLAVQGVKQCDYDVQKGLLSNIVLSGGSMMFPGMCQRMQKELSKLVPPSMMVKLSLAESPRNAAFVGGSILAAIQDVQRSWVTREQYEEEGVAAIHARSICLTGGQVGSD